AAEARVRKLTRNLSALVLIALTWYVAADRCTPSTSAARVSGNVVPIVPEVSGIVESVHVELNQIVKAGDLLAGIDSESYEVAVERAEAELARAGDAIGADTGGVAAAEARVEKAKAELLAGQRDEKRVSALYAAGASSEFRADNAKSRVEKAQAEYDAALAELESARQTLGTGGTENPRIRSAAADLANARLDLERATLRAPTDGGVTNVRVEVGQFANAGTPLMTFISASDVWVEAYLRENALGNVRVGDPAEISLDVAPGRVFDGVVVSTGLGVDWGKAANPGELPQISNPSDWLREPQRFPVVIHFTDDSSLGLRREGGQADVIVYTQGSTLLRPLGWLWIRFVSLLSFLY
ncbi:MAG: HlyD family secretion protein, partial [Myxococcota bacterium]